MSKIKTDSTGKICRNASGKICLCPDGYTVVFPSSDGIPYNRTYSLTFSDGVYVGSGSVNLLFNITFPKDLTFITNSMEFPTSAYNASISIEMTIDGGTGERSVRTIIDISLTDFMMRTWTGQSDYTEVFADGSTFNLSASSATVRPCEIF